ncbi:MAG: hypothetical protein QOE00_2340 [Ilumatobacteraceae bacterium]|jgi:hypothetical protein
MAERSLIGKTGSITGRVAPHTTGEVLVNVRGGTEYYFARSVDGTEVIERGTQVLIVNAAPGRVLYVTTLEVI